MAKVKIPKELTKNKDLIAVPRDIYEDFLAWQKKNKSLETFSPSASEKKSLSQGRKSFSKGEYVNVAQLENELGITS